MIERECRAQYILYGDQVTYRISCTDLAQKAEVSRGTILRHLGNLERLHVLDIYRAGQDVWLIPGNSWRVSERGAQTLHMPF